MAYLMQIAFDNDRRLKRKSYLFEYRGLRFKLVQDNPRKYADHLMTILPGGDIASRSRAFSIASEYLSALAWHNGAAVAVWEAGGRSWHTKYPIRQVRPSLFTFPRLPFGGHILGYSPNQIAKVETDEQRIALTLYREARASNNDYLSFLFFWHVLEVGSASAEAVIERAYRKDRARLGLPEPVPSELLAGRSLGQYLRDDCRNAIAHIKRKPGKKQLLLDNVEERARISVSTNIARKLAIYHIRFNLHLAERLYLVRQTPRGFPRYEDTNAARSTRYAYPEF